jgi:tribbles-like protein
LGTRTACSCKIVAEDKLFHLLRPYLELPDHANIIRPVEVVHLDNAGGTFVFFDAAPRLDLHGLLRQKKRVSEPQAVVYFRQIVSAVAHCHGNFVVVRDLKLQKFVFCGDDRHEVKLAGLDDAILLDKRGDDLLTDKHGCPAYVSPEILESRDGKYSGRSADIWSLGVMLYTMLVGKYPFYDVSPPNLFNLIREGHFDLPASLSPLAKSLICSLLRQDPNERLTAWAILQHPWFFKQDYPGSPAVRGKIAVDQMVPDPNACDTPSMFA